MRDSDPYLADNSPVPEAEEEVSSAAMMESDGDLPGQDESEGPGSDTDLDDLADAPKQSDVEHFASMLREAQRIAVEIKRREVEQKRKTPKTYRGNSKKTLSCRENTRKALASKGFLDIATFMALKGVQVQGADESADSDVLEVDAGMHEVEEGRTVPSRHSDLGRSSGYRQSGGRRVVVEEEEEEEEIVEGAPARTNVLEFERRGGPSVSSGSSGLAHFSGYRRAGEDLFQEEEEEEEEDVVEDAPAHTNVFEVERRSGPSVSSESSGLARFGYWQAGESRVQQEEEEEEEDVVKDAPTCTNVLEVERRSPSVSSVSSGLARFSAYRRAVENRLQDEDEDDGDEGDDNDNDAPSFELEARANALEVEWRGGPSVSSGSLGLARASSSGLARVSDCLRVGEDRMEEDDEDAPALANALKAERCSGLSVSSGSLGLARVSGYLQVGDDRMEDDDEDGAPAQANALEVERRGGLSVSPGSLGLARASDSLRVGGDRMEEEEEGEDAPARADVLEVEWHGGPSVPSRRSGFAPGRDHFAGPWTARRQRVVVAEEEVSSPEPETNECAGARRVEQPSRMSTHSRAFELGGLAGSSRSGGRELRLMEEEEDEPRSVPHTDAEEYKVDRHSGGSVPSEILGSSVSGGPSVDGVDLLGLEGHLSGRDDDFGDGDGDDDEHHHSDDGARKVPDLATDTLKSILDALRSGRDPTHIVPNTPFDRALDLWKDHEKLGCARVSLAAKSKDPCIDIFLRTRLTGMLGVLNLYLDPVLHHTWTEASLIVARIQGSGEKRARNLRQWILDFVRAGVLPSHRYGLARWFLLEHEDIKEAIQLQLREHTQGRNMTAADVVEVVSTPELQAQFTEAGIIKPSISERTARRWLSRLDWQYGQPRKGMYIDGHEREDVVNYRKAFVKRWEQYEKRFHLYDNDGEPLPNPKGFPIFRPDGGFEGRFRLILVTHDESTFFQNDLNKSHWAHKGDKPTPQPKGDGQSLMVSDFLTSDWGRLCDGEGGMKESVNFLRRLAMC